MKKVEAQPFMRNLIIVAAVATAFSSFTLWLIGSWIKYPLFLLEILTIIVLYLIVSGYDVKLTVKHIRIENTHVGLIIDLFLIVSASSLLIINKLRVQGGLIQLALALLCTSLLSGYALLNIFGLTRYFTRLETVVLSYLFSYTFTGFITLASFSIDENARTLFALSIFIVLGLISAFKHKKHEAPRVSRSLSKNIYSLALLLAMVFYALSFYFMYPRFALLPGTDISRHYGSSIILSRTPDLYIGSVYLLAHLHQSLFLSLSNPSMLSAQTALVTLNLMLPLAFYIMAKQYLKKFDARLPTLATLFWVLFTNSFGGFAWLHFAMLKLSTIGQTQLQLLATTADKTYNGTVYGILGLWYVPATVSLVLLMATIFLMRKKEIPTSKYLALFSIIIAALYLTHVTEAVVFALFLAAYGAISRNENLRIDDSIKSSIIGFLFAIIIYYIFFLLTARFIFNLSLLISLFSPILALLLSLVFRRVIRPRLSPFKITLGISGKTLSKTLVLSLLFVHTVALLSWASLTESFHTWQVDTIGLVPWFMYPLMLGINGVLAIIALYYLAQDMKSYKALTLFIAFMIFTFIAGKLVSTINLYFFDAGYSEKRFIWFIKLSLATLAPIPILLSIDRLKKKTIHANIKTVATVAIIGIVVLYGASTTFLNLEYWNIVANNPANQPTSNEMNAINAFKEILDNDPKAWLATVTSTSAGMATFAAPADMLVLKQLLYTAYRPEMAFTQLYRHPAYTHPYIYLHSRDTAHLNKFSDCFLAQYLTMLPLVFDNSEVKIYNVSKPSSPQPNSENVLVIPLDRLIDEQKLYMAYIILSHGFYNYTVAYDLDDKALDGSTIILSFDPPEENVLVSIFQDKFNETLESWDISKGSWRIEDGKLLGSESGKYDEGVILSSTFAENFTATFKVKPLSGNATVQNYVSLVYSWVDSENYRIADVMFSQDGYIYVHFRTIVDGVEKVLPNWPGIKTDLEWDFGNEYNITVTVNGALNEIFINGITFLSSNLESISGKIGLRYLRFFAVSFDDFSVAHTTQVSLRPVKDYLDHLRSGGQVIVLNTNGHGYFADDLFSISNSTVNAQRIEGKNLKVDLPCEVPVQVLTSKNTSTTTLSHYIASLYETPFISHQNYGSGELFYVNIYPIIKTMHENNCQPAFYEILGKLLDDLNLTKLNPDAMLSFDGYVKEIYISNDVRIETSSLLFPLKLELKQVDVEAEDGSHIFHNVTSITITEYSNAIIEADSVIIKDGEGFYAVLQINSTFTVKPSIGSLNLKITTKNEEINLNHVNQFSITPSDSAQLLARTPTLNASQVTFVEFYPFGSLQWRTRTYGQNLNVTGSTQFSVTLSDSYSALKNVKLGASFQRDPPIVTFDVFSTFPTAIFWTLLLLPIFASIFFVFKVRESNQDIHLKRRENKQNNNPSNHHV